MLNARRTDGTFRVFVSTDLGGDADDIQSLVHLLHYTDVLKLEGIISSPGPGAKNEARKIAEWVQRTDLDYLRAKSYPELMSEDEVLALIHQGARKPSMPHPAGTNAGSEALVACARRASDACLWVLAWGSLTDVAQALHDAPDIADKIRINSIGAANTAADPQSRRFIHQHLGDKWPQLWWIEDGMFPGNYKLPPFFGYWYDTDPQSPYGSVAFLQRVIRGRGTRSRGRFGDLLGNAFPTARQNRLGRIDMLKEGDSPTFIYLLSSVVGGVGDPDDPQGEGWGGRWRRPFPNSFPNYYTDLDAEPDVYWDEMRKWRPAFLADWEARWKRYDA
jgi:hypothetical protein